MSAKPECPACKVAMEIGFLVDNGDYSVKTQQEWVAGQADPSFWGGLKVKGRDQHAVVTYRCPACSLLRSYAPPARS